MISNEPSNQNPMMSGRVRVECRVVVWSQCPLCHREHRHVLSPHDHYLLPGLHYWRVDCQGASYFLRLSADAIATAVAQATEIAAEHGLSQQWLADAAVVSCATGCDAG